MDTNKNNNNNILERITNNTRKIQKPPTNTREENIKKKGQAELELNRVKEALRNFATRSNNNNSQLNITRTQVIRYHDTAKKKLISNNPSILEKILSLETEIYHLKLKDIKLSSNFFNGNITMPQPGGTTTIAGAHIQGLVQTQTGGIFNPNSILPIQWHELYKLSKLVSTIRDDPKFPWERPTQGALNYKHLLPLYHNIYLNNGRFEVKHAQKDDEFVIIIRYKSTSYDKYIEWTYTLKADLEYVIKLEDVIKFLRKLPETFVPFSHEHLSNLNSRNDNHDISARIIPMFTKNRSISIVRKAMKESSFPPRFWKMNALKQKAQNNQVKNISGSFLNTKQSRIESFLGKVDDLFTLIANGQEAHRSQSEIRKLIDAFAINPHMYALEAQADAIQKFRKPLQRANNNRQILLANPNYSNNDKRILSFSTGALLIGILELIDAATNAAGITYGKIAIRDVKNKDIGTIIDTMNPDNHPTITNRKLNFNKYAKKGVFNPVPQQPGFLATAVDCLVHFCLWVGNGFARPNGEPFPNLYRWYNHYSPSGAPPQREILQYTEFTQEKLEYLSKILPGHFKLIPLLKEYCKSKNNKAYRWVLSLNILRI